MLQALRGKKSGLLVKIVLGVIVIGFSFFGIESYFIAASTTMSPASVITKSRRTSSVSASTSTASA